MRWNRDDETLLLVLVPTPETSWDILCDHRKVLHRLFWVFSGFVSCRALSPCCGAPLSSPTLERHGILSIFRKVGSYLTSTLKFVHVYTSNGNKWSGPLAGNLEKREVVPRPNRTLAARMTCMETVGITLHC